MTFAYQPYMQKCNRCGRKILVQVWENGNSHIVSLSATCADCLGDAPEEFIKEHPEEAKAITEWKEGK